MSWIVVNQRETIVAQQGSLTEYTVYTEVSDANGIPTELFVFDTSSDAFSSVALLWDIESWPPSKDEAVQKQLDFYRGNSCERTFTNKEKAAAFAADLQRRLQAVRIDWDGNEAVAFGGEQTFLYSSESP
jgi:hypothetical protein